MSLFSFVALIVGAVLGAATARLLNPSADAFTGIANGLGGIIVGVPLAQIIVGILWAVACRRVVWIPPVALLVIFTVATVVALMLVSDDVLGYIVPAVVLISALFATFTVGTHAPFVETVHSSHNAAGADMPVPDSGPSAME